MRGSHADREGLVFSFDDPPPGGHPGEDFGCRCHPEPIDVENADEVQLALWHGVAVGLAVKILSKLLKAARKRGLDRAKKIQDNLKRFEKKLPRGARKTKIIDNPDGSKTFRADVPSNNIPGSYARYEKVVDARGNTISYTKTTYGSDGRIIHVKDKFRK